MRPIVTDRVVWYVSRSVCHSSEPCKNSWTDRDAVWVEDSAGPKEPCFRWGSRSPMGRGNFEGSLYSLRTLCRELCNKKAVLYRARNHCAMRGRHPCTKLDSMRWFSHRRRSAPDDGFQKHAAREPYPRKRLPKNVPHFFVFLSTMTLTF